jgi:hypothetical protein
MNGTNSVTVSEPDALTRRGTSMTWIVMAAVCLVNGALLWHFHDRYWYPTDDGLHAHIAERLLDGEVLNRDVQDIHPGYAHFLNAAAFRLFGVDIVSLRYPLIAAAFLQSVLMFLLLLPRGLALASTGSVAGTALGILQFMSTTANWYCLALGVALAAWMTWLPVGHRFRMFGAGVLIGLLTMFRQLTGVWVAMAVLVLGLLEESRTTRAGGLLLGRMLAAIMLTAAVGYLVLSPETNVGGVLLIALWPIAILTWVLARTRVSNGRVLVLIGQAGAGAVVAALPLLVYHVVHGSVGIWLNDVLLVATGHTQLQFFSDGWYGVLPIMGLYQAVTSPSPSLVVNGLYWALLPLLPALNGLLILRRLDRVEDTRMLAVPLVATFYALVSLYLQGPLYLYYVIGLTLASVLWLSGAGSAARRTALAGITAALALVAVVFHAGQSRHRTSVQILRGERDTAVWRIAGSGLPRASLRLSDEDRDTFGGLLALIEAESEPGDAILALPNDSELYFLSTRRNPTRFYNSTMGLFHLEDVRALLETVSTHPPRLVIFRRADKFVTDEVLEVMHYVQSTYDNVGTLDGADIYRRVDHASSASMVSSNTAP